MGDKSKSKGEKKKANERTKEEAKQENGGPSPKKVDIYRKALKRTLAAGPENIIEDPVLMELRSTLKVSLNQHNKLLTQITAELSSLEELQKKSKQKISKVEKQILDLKKKGIETTIIESTNTPKVVKMTVLR